MGKTMKKMNPRKIGKNRKRSLLITVISLVVVLAVVMGVLLFTLGERKGGEAQISAQETDETTDGNTQEGATQEGAQEGQESATTSLSIEDVTVPVIFINRRRNPFKPLVDMKSEIACSEQAPAPVQPAGGVVTLPPELDNTSQGSSPTVVSTVVTLENVFEENGELFARIVVGDQLFEKVAVGETFASYFKLLSLGEESGATLLYGDERFSFYQGQSIYW